MNLLKLFVFREDNKKEIDEDQLSNLALREHLIVLLIS